MSSPKISTLCSYSIIAIRYFSPSLSLLFRQVKLIKNEKLSIRFIENCRPKLFACDDFFPYRIKVGTALNNYTNHTIGQVTVLSILAK